MKVFLKGKINTEMYNYNLKLSTDKNFLKLSDKNTSKIYKRKNAIIK